MQLKFSEEFQFSIVEKKLKVKSIKHFQVSSIILDLIMTLFMQPIGLFPICAGYSYGILSRWYSWSSHLLMVLSN